MATPKGNYNERAPERVVLGETVRAYNFPPRFREWCSERDIRDLAYRVYESPTGLVAEVVFCIGSLSQDIRLTPEEEAYAAPFLLVDADFLPGETYSLNPESMQHYPDAPTAHEQATGRWEKHGIAWVE